MGVLLIALSLLTQAESPKHEIGSLVVVLAGEGRATHRLAVAESEGFRELEDEIGEGLWDPPPRSVNNLKLATGRKVYGVPVGAVGRVRGILPAKAARNIEECIRVEIEDGPLAGELLWLDSDSVGRASREPADRPGSLNEATQRDVYRDWAAANYKAISEVRKLPKDKQLRLYLTKIDRAANELRRRNSLDAEGLEKTIRFGLDQDWPTEAPEDRAYALKTFARLEAYRKSREESQRIDALASLMAQLAMLADRPLTGGPIHVRGYYRKDGTYVRPHTRRR